MIYILRHGLDDENYIGGWSTGSLILEGQQQIHKIAEFIKEKNLKIEQIYSSDLIRAVETTTIVTEYIDKKVFFMKELREVNKGLLAGLKVSEANRLYPDYVDIQDIEIKHPLGESMVELYTRIEKLLQNFILKEDNCLIVTHRGVINMLYFILNKVELDMDKKKFGVTHASLHQLDPKTKTLIKIKDHKAL